MDHVEPLHHRDNLARSLVDFRFNAAQEPQVLLVEQPLIQHAIVHKELDCLGRMEQPLPDLAVTAQIQFEHERRDRLFRPLDIILDRHSVRRIYDMIHIGPECLAVGITKRGKFQNLLHGSAQRRHIAQDILLALLLRPLLHNRRISRCQTLHLALQ